MPASVRATLIAALLAGVDSFGFTVPAGKSECFHELAKASDRVSGDWKVLSGGMMDLDVQASHTMCTLPRSEPRLSAGHASQVTSPSGDHVYAAEREMQGSFAFYATGEGAAACQSSRPWQPGHPGHPAHDACTPCE